MRNDKGEWIAGFSCATKANNSAEAECWALVQAIEWAWSKCCNKVWFQCNCKDIVDWVNMNHPPMGPLGDMIRVCKEWLDKPWAFRVSHVFREQNAVADRLARIAVRRKCNWIEFLGPPEEIQPLLDKDY